MTENADLKIKCLCFHEVVEDSQKQRECITDNFKIIKINHSVSVEERYS